MTLNANFIDQVIKCEMKKNNGVEKFWEERETIKQTFSKIYKNKAILQNEDIFLELGFLSEVIITLANHIKIHQTYLTRIIDNLIDKISKTFSDICIMFMYNREDTAFILLRNIYENCVVCLFLLYHPELQEKYIDSINNQVQNFHYECLIFSDIKKPKTKEKYLHWTNDFFKKNNVKLIDLAKDIKFDNYSNIFKLTSYFVHNTSISFSNNYREIPFMREIIIDQFILRAPKMIIETFLSIYQNVVINCEKNLKIIYTIYLELFERINGIFIKK